MHHYFEESALILFDFDGLLVDTESLHYKAYQLVFAAENLDNLWTFKAWNKLAHASATDFQKAVLQAYPHVNWQRFYTQKKRFYEELLVSEPAPLMPGAERLLKNLHAPACVVTNSSRAQTQALIRLQPVLQSIPTWITREDYVEPKPEPECYLEALRRFSVPAHKACGFEDSKRGVLALRAARIPAFWVCDRDSCDFNLLGEGCINLPTVDGVLAVAE